MDWSEADVRELLSLSQEGATQYEIPLLNVDGELYFAGERCDSPWIEYTPITATTCRLTKTGVPCMREDRPDNGECVGVPKSVAMCR